MFDGDVEVELGGGLSTIMIFCFSGVDIEVLL